MKKRVIAVTILLSFIVTLIGISSISFVAEDENKSHFVSSDLDGDYNILEVVTSEKQQKLTYMFSGYEPIDLTKVSENADDLQQLIDITKTFELTGSRESTYVSVDELPDGQTAEIYEGKTEFSQLGWYEPTLDNSGTYRPVFFPVENLSTVYILTDGEYLLYENYHNPILDLSVSSNDNLYYKFVDDYVSVETYYESDETLYYNDGVDFVEYTEANPSVSSSDITEELVLYYKIGESYYTVSSVEEGLKTLYNSNHEVYNPLDSAVENEEDNLYYKYNDEYIKKSLVDSTYNYKTGEIFYIVDFVKSTRLDNYNMPTWKFVPASLGRRYVIANNKNSEYIYKSEIQSENYGTWLSLSLNNKTYIEYNTSISEESWVSQNRISFERPVYELLKKNTDDTYSVDYTDTPIGVKNTDIFRNYVLYEYEDLVDEIPSNSDRISIKVVTFDELSSEDIQKADLVYFNTSANNDLASLYIKYNNNLTDSDIKDEEGNYTDTWLNLWGSECNIDISLDNSKLIFSKVLNRELNVIFDDNSFMPIDSSVTMTKFQTLYTMLTIMYPNVAVKLNLNTDAVFNGISIDNLVAKFPEIDLYNGLSYEKVGINNKDLQGTVMAHNVFSTNNISIFGLSTDYIYYSNKTNECVSEDEEKKLVYETLHQLIKHPKYSYLGSNTVRILEIEPLYDFIDSSYFDLRMLGIDPYFTGDIDLTQMSSKQYISDKTDLTSAYDMIYIGSKYNMFYTDLSAFTPSNNIAFKISGDTSVYDLSNYVATANPLHYEVKSCTNLNTGKDMWYGCAINPWASSNLQISNRVGGNYGGVTKIGIDIKPTTVADDTLTKSMTVYAAEEGFSVINSEWDASADSAYMYETYMTNSDSSIAKTKLELNINEIIRGINTCAGSQKITDTSAYITGVSIDSGDNKYIDSLDEVINAEYNEASNLVVLVRNSTRIESTDKDNALCLIVHAKGIETDNSYNFKVNINFLATQEIITSANLGIPVIYEDTNMNGKIYTHVGDIARTRFSYGDHLYDVNTGKQNNSRNSNITVESRYSGTDILKRNMNEILAFANTGRPVFVSPMLKSKAGVRAESLDKASYMYELLCSDSILCDDLMIDFNFDNLINESFTIDMLNFPAPYFDTSANSGIVYSYDGNGVSLVKEGSNQQYYENVVKDVTHGKTYFTFSELNVEDQADFIANGSSNGSNEVSFKFKISTESNYTGSYTVKLYSDTISDGNFSDKEEITGFSLSPTVGSTDLKSGVEYTLTKTLDDSYNGMFHWMLLFTRNDNSDIQFKVEGYTVIKHYEQNEEGVYERKKTDLNILQILPTDGTCTFNMETNSSFQGLLNNVNDYNITVWTKKENDLLTADKQSINSPIIPADDSKNRTGKAIEFQDFDMIVVGFADWKNYITSNALVEEFNEFVKSGKAVLMTHDTSGFAMYNGAVNYYLTALFRTATGQDRYGVTSRYDESSINLLGTTNDPLNILRYGILGGKENRQSFMNEMNALGYDIAYTIDDKSDMYTGIQGFTDSNIFRYYKYGVDNPLCNLPYNFNFGGGSSSNSETNKVSMANSGQISYYPYYICGDLEVALTHTQYYQLNLNDDAISVWYTLEKGSRTKSEYVNYFETDVGDGQNNYYIYSKDNITYTGVGHSNVSNINELKLFVNTLVMAYRSATSASKLIITNDNVQTVGNTSYLYLDYDVVSPNVLLEEEVVSDDVIKLKFKILDTSIAYNKKNYIKFTVDNIELGDLSVHSQTSGEQLDYRDVGSYGNCYVLEDGDSFYCEVDVSRLKEVYGVDKSSDDFLIPVTCKTFTTYGVVEKVAERSHTVYIVKRGLFNIK